MVRFSNNDDLTSPVLISVSVTFLSLGHNNNHLQFLGEVHLVHNFSGFSPKFGSVDSVQSLASSKVEMRRGRAWQGKTAKPYNQEA